MSKVRFSEADIKALTQLDCVFRVTSKVLCFTISFKRFAISEHNLGKPANMIFADAGIDISVFPKRYFYEQIKRWKKEDLSFSLKPKGRPKKKEQSVSEKSIEDLQSEIALLKAENNFLKKLKALD